jgi:hypothetical protein
VRRNTATVAVSARVCRPRADEPGTRKGTHMTRSVSSRLFRAARIADTAEALASGNPRRMARRGKNIIVGQLLARMGVWRRLWR